MASVASSFAQSLPKPKYIGEEEEAQAARGAQRGPRIVTAAELGDTEVVLKVSYIPSKRASRVQANLYGIEKYSTSLWTAAGMAATST